MSFQFRDWDAILIEPLTFDDNDKKFLKMIAKQYPDEIIILNEKSGKKTAFQWIKIKTSDRGLLILLKIMAHFGDYLSYYGVRHQLISDFPEDFINKIELLKTGYEEDLKQMMEALL